MNIRDFFRDPERCKDISEMFHQKCLERNKLIAEGITSKNEIAYNELNKWLIENSGRWIRHRRGNLLKLKV